MNLTNTIKQYNASGLSCLPTSPKKTPSVNEGEDWKHGFPPERFSDCHGVGIICGEASGGLECIDFDNHAGDAKENLTAFMSIPEVKAIYEAYRLPIESTVSGGYHLMFRCPKNEGNRKLASKMVDGRVDCFIETRGEGGYFCADPTPGYKIIKNSILKIATISIIERAILFDNAKALNQVTSVPKTEYENTDRPGDLYNSSYSAISDMKSILKNHGWEDIGNNRWRRPGKKDGISATLGKVASNVFYVFSSNAYPFENNRSYTPFQVLALLEYNGDFKEAAKSVAPEREKKQTTPPDVQLTEIEKLLNSALIDTRKHIEKPPTILSVYEAQATRYEERRIFTLGNFSCIIGKAKSKKTFLISLLTASLLTDTDSVLKGSLPDHKNSILYFDTEQGEFDAYNVIRRIERMAMAPQRLLAFNLRPFAPKERCQIISYAFKVYGDRVGYCVIDGLADLANGVNDEDEATRVVTLLLQWSKIYNCHITTVIHQNKNDEFATGHLGSSVMKKAEIIISVTKSDTNESIIKCDMSRAHGFEELRMIITPDGLPELTESNSKPKPKQAYYTREEVEKIPF